MMMMVMNMFFVVQEDSYLGQDSFFTSSISTELNFYVRKIQCALEKLVR